MIGTRKLPSTAGMAGMRKKNTIITPCIVKSLLYVSSDTRSPAGVVSSSRMRTANAPPTKKKIRHAGEIEQRDALVVARQQPRSDAVAVVEIVMDRRLAGHGLLTFSDFTYSMIWRTCSSVTSP